jgi:hypothetical protein
MADDAETAGWLPGMAKMMGAVFIAATGARAVV